MKRNIIADEVINIVSLVPGSSWKAERKTDKSQKSSTKMQSISSTSVFATGRHVFVKLVKCCCCCWYFYVVVLCVCKPTWSILSMVCNIPPRLSCCATTAATAPTCWLAACICREHKRIRGGWLGVHRYKLIRQLHPECVSEKWRIKGHGVFKKICTLIRKFKRKQY